MNKDRSSWTSLRIIMNEFADSQRFNQQWVVLLLKIMKKNKFVLIHTQSLGQIFIEMRVHYWVDQLYWQTAPPHLSINHCRRVCKQGISHRVQGSRESDVLPLQSSLSSQPGYKSSLFLQKVSGCATSQKMSNSPLSYFVINAVMVSTQGSLTLFSSFVMTWLGIEPILPI